MKKVKTTMLTFLAVNLFAVVVCGFMTAGCVPGEHQQVGEIEVIEGIVTDIKYYSSNSSTYSEYCVVFVYFRDGRIVPFSDSLPTEIRLGAFNSIMFKTFITSHGSQVRRVFGSTRFRP